MNLIKRNILLASLISMFSLCTVACDNGSCTVGDNKSKPASKETQTLSSFKEQAVDFLKKNRIKICVGSTGAATIVLSLKKLAKTNKFKTLYEAVCLKCPTQRTLGWTVLATGLAIVAYGVLSQENDINEEGEEIATESNNKTIAGGVFTTIAGIATLIKQPVITTETPHTEEL